MHLFHLLGFDKTFAQVAALIILGNFEEEFRSLCTLVSALVSQCPCLSQRGYNPCAQNGVQM